MDDSGQWESSGARPSALNRRNRRNRRMEEAEEKRGKGIALSSRTSNIWLPCLRKQPVGSKKQYSHFVDKRSVSTNPGREKVKVVMEPLLYRALGVIYDHLMFITTRRSRNTEM